MARYTVLRSQTSTANTLPTEASDSFHFICAQRPVVPPARQSSSPRSTCIKPALHAIWYAYEQKKCTSYGLHLKKSKEDLYFNPCATRASLARFPATTTLFKVSRARILPPCHPMAFINSGTTYRYQEGICIHNR
mgnify:FL=1